MRNTYGRHEARVAPHKPRHCACDRCRPARGIAGFVKQLTLAMNGNLHLVETTAAGTTR